MILIMQGFLVEQIEVKGAFRHFRSFSKTEEGLVEMSLGMCCAKTDAVFCRSGVGKASSGKAVDAKRDARPRGTFQPQDAVALLVIDLSNFPKRFRNSTQVTLEAV